MIRYPLILVDEIETEKYQMVIIIAKPIISFNRGRMQRNLELVGMKFCDSNGSLFILSGIKQLQKDYNPLNFILNNFKFQNYGEYQFDTTNNKIDLNKMKQIAIGLMKLETMEEAWKEYSHSINESKDFSEVIGNFGFGLQN